MEQAGEEEKEKEVKPMGFWDYKIGKKDGIHKVSAVQAYTPQKKKGRGKKRHQ